MPAGLAPEDSQFTATGKRIPARHRLFGLLAAALVLLCAGPVASAGAQNWFRLARLRVTFAHGAGASHTRQGGST
jgi:hypothetical protein